MRGLYEVTVQTYVDDEFVGRGVTSVRQGPLGALASRLPARLATRSSIAASCR